jgi:hypothetical protein
MAKDEKSPFEEGMKKAGDENLRPGEWIFYPNYDSSPRKEDGRKYIYAPITVAQLEGRQGYRPLSRSSAGLFQEFAEWPEKLKMSKSEPESKQNEKAAIAWAKKHGVLGVDGPKTTMMGLSSLAIEDYLGRPGPDGSIGKAMLNEAFGGQEETVVRFTDEALEARFVWKLYTAAVGHALDLDTITKLMGKEGEELSGGRPSYPSISEIYGRTRAAARDWALNVVAETVSRKVARRCYPVLHGGVGSYQQGWAFNSLLGAMWLQMMWLMTGKTRRCLWCYRILAFDDDAPKKKRRMRDDKDFCGPQHRAKWNYHHGSGKSSKYARKQARDRT